MAKEIDRRSRADPGIIEAELLEFERVFASAMQHFGLPTDNVLVATSDRGKVLRGIGDAIEDLSQEQRQRSLYLSKFMVAVGAGLFDAALNYLWDETISQLRRRVANYDLSYFFDIAEKDPSNRKNLNTEADLDRIDDFKLIRAANDMNLVSDTGYRQLDLIRYMRNFASAAHPNQNEIGSMQLLGFLETCITQVIALPDTPIVVEIKRLLSNIKSRSLSSRRAGEISEFIDDLPTDSADSLAAGLFGIYTKGDTAENVRDNVRMLFPRLWHRVSEDQRQQLGVRYGRYAANGDEIEADHSRSLLDVVDGAAYLPKPTRVAEISTAIEDLLRAHRAWDNFYNEGPRARLLQKAIGGRSVPKGVRSEYVLAIVEVFLSNGHGIAVSADPIYRELIEQFSQREAQLVIMSIANPRISGRLQMALAGQQFGELLRMIEPKLNRRYKEIVIAIRSSNAPLHKILDESRIRSLVRDLGS